MCKKIVINRGEKEIETPRQFQEHFGFAAEKNRHYHTIDPDGCLCPCDIDKTFEANSIAWKSDGYDYYVGSLDNLGF